MNALALSSTIETGGVRIRRLTPCTPVPRRGRTAAASSVPDRATARDASSADPAAARTGVIVQLDAMTEIDWTGIQVVRALINRARASGHRLVVLWDRAGLRVQLAQHGSRSQGASMRISRIANGSWIVARSLQRTPRQLPAAGTGRHIS
jgi:hypothetical protein